MLRKHLPTRLAKKARKSNPFPGAFPNDPSRDAAQNTSHTRAPFASLNLPCSFFPMLLCFHTAMAAILIPFLLILAMKITLFQRHGLSGQTTSDCVQGAKCHSLEPLATMSFSCESDKDDEKLPASTTEKKEGIA
jgi:hypothetical protein